MWLAIKLTHSLRQNQNSKIQQDYRLPTSSLKNEVTTPTAMQNMNSFSPESGHDTELGSLALQMNFELQDLPIKIPTFKYPMIHFRNVTLEEFDAEDGLSPEPGASEYENELLATLRKSINATTGSTTSHDSYQSALQHLSSVSPTTSTDSNADTLTHNSKFLSDAQIGPDVVPNSATYCSPNNEKHVLLGAHKAGTVFKSNDLQHIPTKFKDESMDATILLEPSSRFLPGPVSLLDSVQDVMAHADYSYESYECLMMSAMLLSRSGKAVYFGNKSNYNGKCDYSRFISETYSMCDEWKDKAIQRIEDCVSNFYSSNEFNPQEVIALSYTSCFISVSMLLLWYDYRSYIKSASGVSYLMYNVCPLFEQKPDMVPAEIKYLMKQLQYIIKTLAIPSYDPEFLHEFQSNFSKLTNYYNEPEKFMRCINVQDVSYLKEILETYKRLQYYYNCLSDFLANSLIPMVFEKRDVNAVCVYSPELIYELWGKWFSIFPGDTEVQPPSNPNYPVESAYLTDLFTTLSMYYYSLLVAMDAIIPSVKYLFSVSFLVLNNQFLGRKDIFKANEETYLSRAFKSRDYLLKNNYYTMRLFEFFNRRFTFFIDNIHYITESPYTPYVQLNRLQSRCVPNVQEDYIKNFNTTLIRPEHFPTRKIVSPEVLDAPSVCCVLTRNQEEELSMYTRNIEKLNFCQDRIQYDTESKLLLKDYKPFEQRMNQHKFTLSLRTMMEFYEDRALLLA
ncbi:uncharacterized protein KQ657_003347 [Scheffersomyces spartinae]|uniref:Uncharacterized protein n=1 Tax=Scheffersomyces spartinae TaxID=45513 RepID=A0A9P7VCK1_9ASCO|nr:uncharacterized protein KQ657_003347 [Scheffersomyces spartinae]KAG7195580.1 hypothetical protein KQ657_003347 [Scheffersomyces spartinae]